MRTALDTRETSSMQCNAVQPSPLWPGLDGALHEGLLDNTMQCFLPLGFTRPYTLDPEPSLLCPGLNGALREGLLDNAAAVGALAAVLGDLSQGGASPLRLVGYSLGGRLSLQLAAAHPALFSGVAVVSGSAGLPGESL